jgi:hypothetical protein
MHNVGTVIPAAAAAAAVPVPVCQRTSRAFNLKFSTAVTQAGMIRVRATVTHGGAADSDNLNSIQVQ